MGAVQSGKNRIMLVEEGQLIGKFEGFGDTKTIFKKSIMDKNDRWPIPKGTEGHFGCVPATIPN